MESSSKFDKPDRNPSSVGEKKFIDYLINFIVTNNPTMMLANLQDISQDIQKNYDSKDELNLYRKQFGNLKDCVKFR